MNCSTASFDLNRTKITHLLYPNYIIHIFLTAIVLCNRLPCVCPTIIFLELLMFESLL